MTHMVQSSASLMESINNVVFLTLLMREQSYYQSNTSPHPSPLFYFFFPQLHVLTDFEINAKQMFGNTLMISCISGTNSLLSPTTKTNPPPVCVQTGALVLYKQTALVARGLIRRRYANPIKSPSVPRSVFEDRKSNKRRGSDWNSVVVVVPSVLNCVYAPMVKHGCHPAVTGRSLPPMKPAHVPEHGHLDQRCSSARRLLNDLLHMIESLSVTNTIK